VFSPTGGTWGYLDEARTHWVVLKSNMIPDGTTAPWSITIYSEFSHEKW
jgi:hypothetical protein